MPKNSTRTSDENNENPELVRLRAELAATKGDLASARDETGRERSARINAERAGMSAQERELATMEDSSASKITSLQAELDQAENRIAELADEPGHGKEIAALNRQMSTAAAALAQEESRKAYIADQRANFKNRAKTTLPEPAGGDDRALANGAKLSAFPKITQEWLKKHPKAFTDRRYLGECITAVTKGIQVEGLEDNSPELLRFVEQEIGEGTQTTREDDPDYQVNDDQDGDDVQISDAEQRALDAAHAAGRPSKPQAPAAGKGSIPPPAPPSRQTPHGSRNNNRRRVWLTAEQKETADSLYASMKNPADRYLKYAENMNYMENRETGHFAGRN